MRRLQLGAALIVVLALVVGVVYLVAGRDDGTDQPTAVEVGKRTQRVLLVQVRTADGQATSNLLLAHDPEAKAGAELLVAPGVLATAPGSQVGPFSQILATSTPEASRQALGDLMGVTIDSSWVLDATAAAALVDAVGGVPVTIDAQVLSPDGTQVLLPPGQQTLNGQQALLFATYRGTGEAEQVRMARLQQVFDAVRKKLPADQPQLVTLLGRLGSTVDGLDTDGLAAFLLALNGDETDDALTFDTVPVTVLQTGGDVESLRLDPDANQKLVDRLLSASVPQGVREGNNRVKVFNGVGTPMLGAVVRQRLVAAGLVYVPGGNAPTFGIATSEIQIGEPTPEHIALGKRVAAALGLPESALRSSDPTTVADVIVVVGKDFSAG